MAYSADEQKQLLTLTSELLELAKSGKKFSPEKTIVQLRHAISFHDRLYYVQSEPKISDYDYDTLFRFLKQIEESNPDLVTDDSPTQRVARGLTDQFETVAHLVPMLSLDNSYSVGDLYDFDRRVKELSGTEKIEYCAEPKFDGASIALVYENDKLIRGATRGDGTAGENITNNLKTLRTIPLKAEFSKHGIHRVEIRGEVLIAKDIFNRINRARVEEGEKPFGNPRNSASGSLRQKDPSKVAGRGLEAFLYQVAIAEDKQGNDLIVSKLKTHHESIRLLHDLGFRTPFGIDRLCRNIPEVLDYINEWEARRDDFAYEIDGIVIKANERSIQIKAGFTSHHPRWAVAYKFKPRQAETILEEVEFQVGRTGIITPVAKVKPVYVAGVTIRSISLFNEDVINEKDLHIGDTVLIERAGDVIPYIVGPVMEKRQPKSQRVKYPARCPACHASLVRSEDEAAWRCINLECPEQVAGRIIHFVSKDAMDIAGLGEQNVRRFIELGFLKSPDGIYHLPFERMRGLEGFGEKSIEKLEKAIAESKAQPLYRLIYALGIRHVGETTAKNLARAVSDINEFKRWSKEQFMMMEDIGPKVAQSLVAFFHEPNNIDLINRLKDAGVNTYGTKEIPSGNRLAGKTFLFTGSLSKFTRDEAENMVEKNGGRNLGSVSPKLNYLVVGENAGSKLGKAQKLGTVQIISEEDFLKLIG